MKCSCIHYNSIGAQMTWYIGFWQVLFFEENESVGEAATWRRFTKHYQTKENRILYFFCLKFLKSNMLISCCVTVSFHALYFFYINVIPNPTRNDQSNPLYITECAYDMWVHGPRVSVTTSDVFESQSRRPLILATRFFFFFGLWKARDSHFLNPQG